jgi:hypothetical protein
MAHLVKTLTLVKEREVGVSRGVWNVVGLAELSKRVSVSACRVQRCSEIECRPKVIVGDGAASSQLVSLASSREGVGRVSNLDRVSNAYMKSLKASLVRSLCDSSSGKE